MGFCYRIQPIGSYVVIRKCSKCGCKTKFINTNHFRVNANGNLIDVWLIYQCENCKNTFNVTIYERRKPSLIHPEEYHGFLDNEEALALQYGNDKSLFAKNGAEIDLSHGNYEVIKNNEIRYNSTEYRIENPFLIKIRTEKIVADILFMSRKQVKEYVTQGLIRYEQNYLSENTIIFADPSACYGKQISESSPVDENHRIVIE